jgi:5-methylcytosine-specific restriction endonuclease McrA
VTTTLLLNASFEPLCIVPLRRAVVLVLAEKADVLAADDMMVRSAMTAMAAPRVIRLRAYVRVPYRAVVPLTRRADAHRWDNVVLACRPCNGQKGDRTLAELGWTVDRTPVALTRRQWLIVGYAEAEPVWVPYLAAATA